MNTEREACTCVRARGVVVGGTLGKLSAVNAWAGKPSESSKSSGTRRFMPAAGVPDEDASGVRSRANRANAMSGGVCLTPDDGPATGCCVTASLSVRGRACRVWAIDADFEGRFVGV